MRIFAYMVGACLAGLYTLPIAMAADQTEPPVLQGLTDHQASLVGKTLISPEDAWGLGRDVVYQGHEETFYCACSWASYDKFDGTTSPELCRLEDRADEASKILSWDNVVPSSWFGKDLTCWREGNDACHRSGVAYRGQACCALLDRTYMEMSVDLHNLVPAVLSVNQAKSSSPTGLVRAEPRVHGQCNFEAGDTPRRYEPAAEIRGDVARTWLYFSDTYGMTLSRSYRNLLERWHRQDPVDEWEKERATRITALQGRTNPYVQNPDIGGEQTQ